MERRGSTPPKLAPPGAKRHSQSSRSIAVQETLPSHGRRPSIREPAVLFGGRGRGAPPGRGKSPPPGWDRGRESPPGRGRGSPPGRGRGLPSPGRILGSPPRGNRSPISGRKVQGRGRRIQPKFLDLSHAIPEPEKKKIFPKARMKLVDSVEFPSTKTISERYLGSVSEEKRSVQVLICSANLGNAQPDDFSVNEWIPQDGRIKFVLPSKNSLHSPPQLPSMKSIGEKEGQFDIVVIGMQEATFEAEVESGINENDTMSASSSEEEEDDDEEEESAEQSNTRNLTDKMLGATLKATKATLKAGKIAGKATLKMGTATIKAGKAAQTLVKAKDHTNKATPTVTLGHTPLEDGGMSDWDDTIVLHYLFEEHLPSYTRALSYQLGEMRLIIYYLTSTIDLDVLSVKTKATGKHGLANKGGISAEVTVNSTTRLSFLTAHLEAHEGKKNYSKRCSSCRSILNGTKSSSTPFRHDASLASHFTFFLGDLNFRTKLPNLTAGSEEHIRKCRKLVAKGDWRTLNRFDELSNALQAKDCLVGFRTPYCNFNPTFKVARGDGYRYSIKRSPSYTDRILYRIGDQLNPALGILLYEPVGTFRSSDHKPVRGAFDIQLNKKIELHESPNSQGRILQEHLSVFISSIQGKINPIEYNQLRQTSDGKVDLPNPRVSFVSTPCEAVRIDDDGKNDKMRKLLGLGKLTTTKNKSSADGNESKKRDSIFSYSSGGSTWPGTSVVASSFEPNWTDEEIHFQVRTRKVDGTKIDLSGALLHISLFNGKGSDEKLLGSFPLNLARLITLARGPRHQDNNSELKASHDNAEPKGWSYEEKEALYGSPVKNISKTLLNTKLSESQRNSMSRLSREPSKAFRNLMSQTVYDKVDVEGWQADVVQEKIDELNLVSLKLDEMLTESGTDVGRIKCSIDAWWTTIRVPWRRASAK